MNKCHSAVIMCIFVYCGINNAHTQTNKSREEIAIENFAASAQEVYSSALEKYNEEIFQSSRRLCLDGNYRTIDGVEISSKTKIRFQSESTKKYFESGNMRNSGCLGFIMLTRGKISDAISALPSNKTFFYEGVVRLIDNSVHELKKIPSSTLKIVQLERDKLVQGLEEDKKEYVQNLSELSKQKAVNPYRIQTDKGDTFDGRCVQGNKNFSGRYSNSYGGTWNICGVGGCTSGNNRHESILEYCKR